jgi:CHAD domain-containing protein
MEDFGSLASSRYPGRHKESLKHLRKAQESLGGLNDAERIRVLMASFPNQPRPESGPRPQRIKTSDSTRDTERLLREAAAAYRKMEKLESL